MAFGLNPVREAIQDPSRIQKVLIEDGLKNPAAQKLKDEIMRSGVRIRLCQNKSCTNTPKKPSRFCGTHWANSIYKARKHH